jgi:hypothetical protein
VAITVAISIALLFSVKTGHQDLRALRRRKLMLITVLKLIAAFKGLLIGLKDLVSAMGDLVLTLLGLLTALQGLLTVLHHQG